MSTKYVQPVLMEAGSVQALNRTGVYYVGATPTAVAGGAFVKVTGMLDNSAYSVYVAGIKDLNRLKIIAPAADTDKDIYIVDPVLISSGTINGNVYREGAKTIGLTAAAGESVRIKKLRFNDIFELGDGNFTGAVTVGQYAILGTTVDLVPSGSIPATKFTVQIEEAKTVSQGTTANVNVYVCRVVNVV